MFASKRKHRCPLRMEEYDMRIYPIVCKLEWIVVAVVGVGV
jgi:hypothetical protein